MPDLVGSDFSFPLLLIVVLAGLIPLARLVSKRSPQEMERELALREAEVRSKRMLEELLSQQESEQLRRLGFLEVRSRQQPERVYRVPKHPGLVAVYENGKLARRLCVGAVETLPSGDLVLMHKLMIEADEETYVRTANELPPYPAME